MADLWHGQCPKCGKFCSKIRALQKFGGDIEQVIGDCLEHGEVDLTEQDWVAEDFFD